MLWVSLRVSANSAVVLRIPEMGALRDEDFDFLPLLCNCVEIQIEDVVRWNNDGSEEMRRFGAVTLIVGRFVFIAVRKVRFHISKSGLENGITDPVAVSDAASGLRLPVSAALSLSSRSLPGRGSVLRTLVADTVLALIVAVAGSSWRLLSCGGDHRPHSCPSFLPGTFRLDHFAFLTRFFIGTLVFCI